MSRLQRMTARDGGFTLVEALVASALLILVMTMTLSVASTTGGIVGQARDTTDLNEEARGALNRMTRELREASAITAVTNPAQSPSLSVGYATPRVRPGRRHLADVRSGLQRHQRHRAELG
jgi:type II secretory pathway component PulJ